MKHLERALDGQNQWWKYLLVLFVALIIGQSIGSIPLGIIMAIKRGQLGDAFVQPDNNMDFSAYGIDLNIGLILMIIPFLITLLFAILGVKVLHKRNLNDVINGGSKFRWKRFWMGVGIWGIGALLLMLLGVVLDPDNFEFRFNIAAFIPLVAISVLLIPFQAGTEEYLFRGYLAQGVANLTKQRWLVVLIPSLLFTLMHGVNPEVKEYGFWVMMPQYFMMALVFALIAVLDDGIELAIGIHAINNVMSSVFMTSKASAIQTHALFFQKEVDPASEFLILLAYSVVMIVVLAYIYKWDFSVLWQKIKKPEPENNDIENNVSKPIVLE